MAAVLLDLSMSLDGLIAGPDDDDAGLHDWYFAESDDTNRGLVDEIVQTTGALVMGRRAYDLGVSVGGFADTPYQVPHFVLTHTPPVEKSESGVTFTYVTDGVEPLIDQARAAAGDRYVTVGGGADIARQCLAAGLVDEVDLHVVPVLLGQGLRLFAELDAPVQLDLIREVSGAGVSHLRYRVRR